ncbi:polysaccharide deacetylase family protein [Bowmanella sp. Y26]|uniref:carbohydrate-binding protein n=1 Tax=Bowmanella yangjiangensis TaxID=2811230 RepID=UPI001BDCC9BD|nr:carbohydrate-binding protein [Bowmanella yangjiangensis]MBT1064534.1 polysaccharide deacetylase family protein [Bowmanella yangjiangensis]
MFKRTLLPVGCIGLCLSMSVAATPTGTIYLTFDDGPMNATPALIQILNDANVKATFYFNSWHLDGIGDENEDQALAALKFALESGHVIANHSYDHMVHNCVGKTSVDEFSAAECNATAMHNVRSYQNVALDASKFDKNLTSLRQYLPGIDSYPNFKGENLARLPYTNGWRVTKDFRGDGLCATTDEFQPWDPRNVCDPEQPFQSSLNGMAVSDLLADQRYVIHGWDVDWAPENWGIPFPAESLTEPAALLAKVDAAKNTCAASTLTPDNSTTHTFPCGHPLHQDKVIILTHDFLFEDGKRGQGATLNLPKLASFLALAQAAGYVFDTLDNYATPWQDGQSYQVGDYVSFEDVIYRALVAHTSQASWAPGSQSNLWVVDMASRIWAENVEYQVGDQVFYMGNTYTVLSAHTSNAQWTPNSSPTLFSL